MSDTSRKEPDLLQSVPYMDNRLKLEINTKLQISLDGLDVKINSEFVGMAGDQCIIATFPDTGLPETLDKTLIQGTHTIVRYVYDGKVFGFESELLGSITTPVRLLFINYPKVIEKIDLRRQERLSCLLPAKLKVEYNAISGTIIDLSKAGCGFKTKIENVYDEKILLERDDIELEFLLPGIEDSHLISVNIKNYAKRGNFAFIGIQFTKIREKTKRYLDTFIDRHVSFEV
ncbi:MAG: flagellar brake protein [Nitrospirae bacterium]|nr:flagellar brake protein [Nitrospirota bacterium]